MGLIATVMDARSMILAAEQIHHVKALIRNLLTVNSPGPTYKVHAMAVVYGAAATSHPRYVTPRICVRVLVHVYPPPPPRSRRTYYREWTLAATNVKAHAA